MSAVLSTVERAVSDLVSTWRASPPVTVVRSVSDLPFPAPADVKGAFLPRSGQVFVVADTQSACQVPDTLAHEVIGHHAMRVDLGSRWKSFMHAVQHGARNGDLSLYAHRLRVRAVYVDNNGCNYLSPTQEADEMAAAVVEARFNSETGRLQVKSPFRARLCSALGNVLRERLYADRPATMSELEGRLLAAEHRLRHGGPLWGLGYRLRQWHTAQMAKPWNPLDRPMSLGESEELLRAEADRTHWRREWKFLWAGFQLVAAVVLFGLGCLAVLWGLSISLAVFFR